METELTPISKLTKDIKEASVTLSRDEARFLVDAYYMMQDDRIRTGGQIRALTESGEPHEVLAWLMTQRSILENQVKRALDAYSAADPVGQWAREQNGIGPVLSAGLLAHIDIKQAPTVGHIWRYAGLDPTVKWEKKQKRPWNAALKVLCWKIGESFTKVSGNPDAYYGQVYAKRKIQEVEKNENLDFKDQAEHTLKEKKFTKDTATKKCYEAGKLPPARLQLRAQRYAVKLFLAGLHEVWYFVEFGELPPKPYAIAILGHAHQIGPPHADLVPGLLEARKAQGKGTV